MAHTDLDNGRRYCAQIRELVARHPAGTHDHRALQQLQQFCRAATSALGDRSCRELAGAVEDWACGLFIGADHLRPELLRELDALEARITAIEAMRNEVAKHRAAA